MERHYDAAASFGTQPGPSVCPFSRCKMGRQKGKNRTTVNNQMDI